MKKSINFRIPSYIKGYFDKYKYVLLVCSLGMIFVLWPQSSSESEQPTVQNSQYDLESEIKSLESGLAQLFGQINGVGEVQVMLTANSGRQYTYATDQNHSTTKNGESSSTSTQTELVIISSDGQDSPVVLGQSSPNYIGALVVCEGGEDPRVQLELTRAIKSLTGITADNIIITKMKD